MSMTASRLRGLKRGVVPFVPTDIAGLIAWYDFSDATKLYVDAGTTLVSADGDAIYQCNDKSGVGNHVLQATLANRPLYKTAIQNGRSVGRGDATDAMSSAAFAGGDQAQPDTVFVVAKMTTSGGAGSANAAFDGLATGKRQTIYRKTNTAEWTLYSGTTEAVDGASDTNWHVFGAIFNGASSKLYVDGGAGTTLSPGTQVIAGARLFFNGAGGGFWRGDIGECTVYSGALSVANLNALGGYLGTKWGTTWTTAS